MALFETDTEASRDLLGFSGDYDNRSARLEARVQLPLLGPLALELGGLLSSDRYRNENLVDFLTDDGVGTPNPSRRRDTLTEGRATLSWAFTDFLSAELSWRGTRAHSNVDVFDYRRSIVGLQLVARRPWL